jgi:insulysin
MNDPEDLPGLAHFTEHAVFLGNDKYPEENGFSKFLSANSGTRNAATFQDATNFHFNVASKSFKEGLDR